MPTTPPHTTMTPAERERARRKVVAYFACLLECGTTAVVPRLAAILGQSRAAVYGRFARLEQRDLDWLTALAFPAPLQQRGPVLTIADVIAASDDAEIVPMEPVTPQAWGKRAVRANAVAHGNIGLRGQQRRPRPEVTP